MKEPWSGRGYYLILNSIVNKDERPALIAEEAASPAGALAVRCWKRKAEERPTFALLNEEYTNLFPTALHDVNRFEAPLLELGRAVESTRGLHALLGLTDEQLDKARRTLSIDAIRDEFVAAIHDAAVSEATAKIMAARGILADNDDLEMIDYILGRRCDLPSKVQSDIAAGQYHGGPLQADEFDYKHDGMGFDDFVNLKESKIAELGRAHVLVLRLYTSAVHQKLNRSLRGRMRPNPFAKTIVCLFEAIRRLRSVEMHLTPWNISETVYLFRGLQNVREPETFALNGGCELQFVSTSTNESVVARYAQSGCPTVLKFRTRGMNRGTSLRSLSLPQGG